MLLAPDLFEVKEAYVAVDTKGPYTYGASVMDFEGFFGQKANAKIAVKVDRRLQCLVPGCNRASKVGG